VAPFGVGGRRASRPARGGALRPSGDGLAEVLGWASVGLGVPLVAAAGPITRGVGVGDGPKQRNLARVVGGRELVAAAGLLFPSTRPRWIWSRVGGDAMDLMVLGRALRHHSGRGRSRTLAATAAVAGISAVDLYAAVSTSRSTPGGKTVQLTATTTVRKEPDEVYAYWRQLDHLGSFMAHVDDVTTTSPTTSHWRVQGPHGHPVEWDAEIFEDIPGKRLAWRSVGDADVSNEGSVTFTSAPGDRGTEVHVLLKYTVPGGKVGEVLANLFGEHPSQQLADDLRRFKQVMETGQVVLSDGAPNGVRARRQFPQHAAQPLSADELAEVKR
jgi:uncharacterized membrane protein